MTLNTVDVWNIKCMNTNCKLHSSSCKWIRDVFRWIQKIALMFICYAIFLSKNELFYRHSYLKSVVFSFVHVQPFLCCLILRVCVLFFLLLLCIMQLMKSYFKQFVAKKISIAIIWLSGLQFSSTLNDGKYEENAKLIKYCSLPLFIRFKCSL